MLEGRDYESEGSVYKFTGKERDPESEYDYFGARYYDARIGRWGQVEPLLDKYVSFSPYVYSLNNPLIIDDPNGKDPRRDQMANLNEVTNLMREHILEPVAFFIYDLRGIEGPRYIYTKQDKFMDLVHFFAAAYVSSVFDLFAPEELSTEVTKLLGEMVEIHQTMEFSSSAWDPEDLRSNAIGAIFGNELNILETYFMTESYIQKFENFAKQRGIFDKNDPSISSDKIRIIESDNDPPLGFKFDYSPYGGNKIAQKAELKKK